MKKTLATILVGGAMVVGGLSYSITPDNLIDARDVVVPIIDSSGAIIGTEQVTMLATKSNRKVSQGVKSKKGKTYTEDMALRTSNSRHYRNGTDGMSEFYTGDNFIKDVDGEWYEVDYSTSTLPSMLFSLIPKAYADTFAPSIDGYFGSTFGAAESWAGIRADAGDESSAVATVGLIQWRNDSTVGQFRELLRGGVGFNTSSLPDGVTVDSATLDLYGQSKTDSQSVAPDIDIYLWTPDTPGSLGNGDFDACGATSYTGSPISYASWSTSAYNTFTFNSTGKSAISLTGSTYMCTVNANYDIANVAPTHTTTVTDTYIRWYTVEQTGTANDPVLTVTYSTYTPINENIIYGELNNACIATEC